MVAEYFDGGLTNNNNSVFLYNICLEEITEKEYLLQDSLIFFLFAIQDATTRHSSRQPQQAYFMAGCLVFLSGAVWCPYSQGLSQAA